MRWQLYRYNQPLACWGDTQDEVVRVWWDFAGDPIHKSGGWLSLMGYNIRLIENKEEK